MKLSPIPAPYDILVKLGVAALMLWGAWFLVNDYLAMKKALAAKQGVENVTSTAIDAAGQATAEQAQVRVVIEDKRAAYERKFEDIKRENKIVREWADTPNPMFVREPASNPIDGPESDPVRGTGADETD